MLKNISERSLLVYISSDYWMIYFFGPVERGNLFTLYNRKSFLKVFQICAQIIIIVFGPSRLVDIEAFIRIHQ